MPSNDNQIAASAPAQDVSVRERETPSKVLPPGPVAPPSKYPCCGVEFGAWGGVLHVNHAPNCSRAAHPESAELHVRKTFPNAYIAPHSRWVWTREPSSDDTHENAPKCLGTDGWLSVQPEMLAQANRCTAILPNRMPTQRCIRSLGHAEAHFYVPEGREGDVGSPLKVAGLAAHPESAGGEQVAELPPLDITQEDRLLSDKSYETGSQQYWSDVVCCRERQLLAAQREIETLRSQSEDWEYKANALNQNLVEAKELGQRAADHGLELGRRLEAAEAELAALRAAQPQPQPLDESNPYLYTMRPKPVTALQWTGENLEEVRKVFGFLPEYLRDKGVLAGDYLIKPAGGGPFWSMASGSFADRYTRAAQPVDATNSQGWCSSCDKMHDCVRPLCPKCNDYLIFASDDTAEPVGEGFEALAYKALHALKLRIHFIGWPSERMIDGRPDWAKEIQLLEAALASRTPEAGGEGKRC